MRHARIRGGDDLDVGVLGLDGAVKQGETPLRTAVGGGAAVEIVLVADFDVSEFEGGGMAVLGAAGAPLGGRLATDIFNFIQRRPGCTA